MKHYFRLALVAPLRSPLFSTLPYAGRIGGPRPLKVFFHSRLSSGSPIQPPVDPEVRALEVEMRKAALRKAEAEARAADIEAGAAKARAEAEAGAAKVRSEAEARAADIEAGAAKARAKAEARAADIEAGAPLTLIASLIAGSVGAVFLLGDYLWQEEEFFIRLRIKHKLCSCILPNFIPSELDGKVRLAINQEPLVLLRLPTMMVGPTGSGKSTQLMDLARHHINQKTPTFILKLRLAKPNFAGKDKDAAGLAPALTLPVAAAPTTRATNEDFRLDNMAHQLFSQIGYPARRSYLGRILSGGTFKAIGNEFTLPETTNRMEHAIKLLFEVAAALSAERRRSLDPQDRTMPVLLFDEVQDLVKSSRLGDSGGRRVLECLAMEIVRHCVDTHQLRVAVAGSSALLIREFPHPAKSTRWYYYYQRDPSPEVLSAELVRRGYTKEEAEHMIAVCGTRLRLFDGPLSQQLDSSISASNAPSSGTDDSSSKPTAVQVSKPPVEGFKLPVELFIEKSIATATREFEEEFSKLGAEGAKLLTVLLDRIWVGSQPKPSLRDLDALIENPAELSLVIYVDERYQLCFQSQLHRHVWGLRKRGGEMTLPTL